MPAIEWTLLCRSAYFDRDHRLTLFDVETTLPIPTRPAGAQGLTFVLRFKQTLGNGDIHPTVLVTPPVHPPWLADDVRDFCFERHDVYAVLHMPRIVLDEEGIYAFDMHFGEGISAAVQLTVGAARPSHRTCVHGAF
jgi:hypothetical protein